MGSLAITVVLRYSPFNRSVGIGVQSIYEENIKLLIVMELTLTVILEVYVLILQVISKTIFLNVFFTALLRCNEHTIQFTHLKSVLSSIFADMCNDYTQSVLG